MVTMQAGVIDAVVADAGDHLHAAFLQLHAVDPAGRLDSSPADLRVLALQQRDLAGGCLASAATTPPRDEWVESMPHSALNAGIQGGELSLRA